MAACRAYASGSYAGLTGRKLEAGTADRQDLLLFGEAQEEGGEPGAEEDAWIGLGSAMAQAAPAPPK